MVDLVRLLRIRDKLAVIRKRKWFLITCFVIVFTTVAVVTFTTPSVYRASARILIEPRLPPVIPFEGFDEIYTLSGRQHDYYQTQYQALRNPELGERVHANLPRRLAARNSPGQIAAMINVRPIPQTYLVDIQAEGEDPEFTAAAANGWAEQFIRQSIDNKLRASRQALDQLMEQVEGQREELEKARRALQSYQRETGIVSTRKISQMEERLIKARLERMEREAQLNQVERIMEEGGAIEASPLISTSPLVQRLLEQRASLERRISEYSQRYRPLHPQMLKLEAELENLEERIDREIRRLISFLRTSYEEARAAEESLQREILDLGEKGILAEILQSDVEAKRTVLEALISSVHETSAAERIELTNIQVVGTARVPSSPFRPRVARNLFYGLLAGLAGGLAVVFVLENIDDSVKTPSDAKKLELPFLGSIPIYSQSGFSGKSLPVLEKPQGLVAESYRMVRTGVKFSAADRPLKSILVTSSFSREGKSDVSAQLAVIFAQAGERVLLVDSDLRKPRVEEIFGLDKQGPGLTDVLTGQTVPEKAVVASDVSNLHILPRGFPAPNPAELLASERARRVLADLRESWDRLIFDSPPLLSVTDAANLAAAMDGVVLVAKAGSTSSRGILHGREQLDSVKARVIGVILNGVDIHQGDYYHYSY